MNHSPVTVGDSPIVFNVVTHNDGNGYSSQTGVFTAPTAGDYIFYAKVQDHSNTDE
jgi:hypothetical protein